jgi:(S)-3,5-dihydroxyphenylglycine transaminase
MTIAAMTPQTILTGTPKARSNVMNFLNEIAQRHPQAISFASGRPAERFFRLGEWAQAATLFFEHHARRLGVTSEAALQHLAQYGPTSGIAREEIAKQLRIDHGVPCVPDRVVVTAGCQEAMALCIVALCSSPGRVLLVRNPTYIGATGVADAAGIPVVPIAQADGEPLDSALKQTIANLAAQGITPGALYLIPDFDNPTGDVLSRELRQRIIEVSAHHRIAILEDNPYGMFRFDGAPVPSMAQLDSHGCVIHLGTYSKTMFPTIRVGSAAFPETLFGDFDSSTRLIEEVVRRKSFLTVNTSQYCQAVVAGVLHQSGFTLADHVREPASFYRTNRDVMIEALQEGFRGYEERVSWSCPEGGFFLTLKLPFEFGDAELEACAASHRVLAMPMRYFAIDDSHRDMVRLAYSNVDPDAVREGIGRFCTFAISKLRE